MADLQQDSRQRLLAIENDRWLITLDMTQVLGVQNKCSKPSIHANWLRKVVSPIPKTNSSSNSYGWQTIAVPNALMRGN